jgi:cytochrome c-type biogenesis protein CcmH/NrfG
LQLPDAAAESYSEALRLDPKSVLARIGLGRLRLAGDPTAAETLFLEALQRQPHNAVALNDLGIARDLLGRHQDAQTAYRQAIGLEASMSGAEVNLALSLAMSGRADDAAPCCGRWQVRLTRRASCVTTWPRCSPWGGSERGGAYSRPRPAAGPGDPGAVDLRRGQPAV